MCYINYTSVKILYISRGKRGKASHLFVSVEVEGHSLVSSICNSKLWVQYSLNYNIMKPIQWPCKEIQPLHSKGDQPWDFFGRNDAKAETPVLWPPHAKSWLIGKDWCWERLGAGGEGDNRGWDGWMASRTRWTWVWVNSGRWWWTGRPGVLRFMGSQRVGHDWAAEMNWTELYI